MVSKFRSGSHILMYGFNTNNRETLNKFFDSYNESYTNLYLTSNWNDLKKFIKESFIAFECLIQTEYSRKAESILIHNFNTLSTINSSLKIDDSVSQFLSNKHLLYSNIVSTLVLSSCVKINHDDSELETPELDLLVTKYNIYTNLFLSLVDSCVKLCEFDDAVENLIELGIVQYYLRTEIYRYVREHLEGSGRSSKAICASTYTNLYRRGIYICDFGNIEQPAIIRHVIDNWKNQIDLEVWLLLVKIIMNIDSIYNLLNKIETLPLSLRLKILFGVKFMFFESPLSDLNLEYNADSDCSWDNFEEDYEDGEFIAANKFKNAVYRFLSDKRSLNEIRERISRVYIVSQMFSSSFNFQCFLIEGMLLFSHMCKDFYHEVFSLVYSILFDVLQIFISINCYYRYYNKKEITNKVLYGCLGLCKLHFNHYNSMPPILQLVYNQYRLDRKLNAVSSDSLMPSFTKASSVLKNFRNPILGFCRVSTVLKSDLEYNFLFQAANIFNFDPVYYDYFIINPNTQINSSSMPIQFNVDFNDLVLSTLKDKWKVRSGHLGTLIINGTEISRFNKSQDMYNHIHFMRSLYNMSSNLRIKNIDKTKYSRRFYSLYLRHQFDGYWVIRRFPDNIMAVVISCCCLIDDVYSFIHYAQSLEYLQYKDTLKTKNRAFVKTLLPFVPNRSSKDAKKILVFQKHIKTRLRFNLMSSKNFIPFVQNLNKNYTPLSKILFRSAPKPKCEIYLRNVEDMGSKISFKISSRRDVHSSISVIRVKTLKNPLLSSSKALYGHLYNHGDFKNNRSNRKSISKYNSNLNVFLNTHTSGENTDNNRFFGAASKCIHVSMGSSFNECNFCNQLNNFKHISHLLNLIDLLSHYLFTLNISCTLDYSLYFRNRMVVRSDHDLNRVDGINNISLYVRDLSVYFSDILSQIDKSFNAVYATYRNRRDYPFKILKEIIENAILLSLSTVFHEKYYNHLISRLAIYNLVKGRYNLAVSLIKQTLSDGNMYNINYGADDNHLEENYICDIDRNFKIQLLSKVYIELMDDLYSFRRLNGECDYENMDPGIRGDCSEEYYYGYRMGIMKAVSYMKEATSKFMESMAIIDSNYRQMDCDFSGGESWKQLFANTQMISDRLDDYTETIKAATESLLNAISLDPLDYKSWYYLAQCSLYSNDLYFAYRCCERSIECFDSSIAPWITKVICSSSRIRTCSPFHTNDEVWSEYAVKRPLEDSISFRSLPSPFEPLFPLNIDSFEDLEEHLNRWVGGDLELCMCTLNSLENHGNVYVASAILQLVTRNHSNFNAFFPWELPYLGNVPLRYKHGFSHNYDTVSPGTPRSDRFSSEFISNVKRMVSCSVESNYPICAVPFMNLVLETFLKDQVNLKCRHHSGCLFSYNSTALSQSFLQEEFCGWATCIECLAQIGEPEISQMLLPILEIYLEYFSVDKNKKRNEKNVCKSIYTHRNKKEIVQGCFSADPSIATDLSLEVKYLGVYTRCYNTTGSNESLKALLQQVRGLNSKNNYRKFALLENRLLVGLKEYNRSVQLGNQLHRNAIKFSQNTDFDLEYRSLLAFTHSLKMIGERYKSRRTGNFAKQMHLTTPVLKLELCLNVPV